MCRSKEVCRHQVHFQVIDIEDTGEREQYMERRCRLSSNATLNAYNFQPTKSSLFSAEKENKGKK